MGLLALGDEDYLVAKATVQRAKDIFEERLFEILDAFADTLAVKLNNAIVKAFGG